MRYRRLAWPFWATGIVVAALTASGCAGTSPEEFEAAVARFEALPDEAKAYVCADDLYAVAYEIEGFVLIEQCPSGTADPAVDSVPLSAEFEAADQDYLASFYAENPPEARQLREVDAARLCDLTDEQLLRDIEQWRSQTTFPSWNGVEYVPSDEHEIARLEIWRDVACPLVRQ